MGWPDRVVPGSFGDIRPQSTGDQLHHEVTKNTKFLMKTIFVRFMNVFVVPNEIVNFLSFPVHLRKPSRWLDFVHPADVDRDASSRIDRQEHRLESRVPDNLFRAI